jgi:hypothetical protein
LLEELRGRKFGAHIRLQITGAETIYSSTQRAKM